MKKSFRIFLIIFQLLCLSISGVAQEFSAGKGNAVIYFEPQDHTIIKLDTSLIHSSYKQLSLTEGKYIIKAWAPTKKLFIDTLVIKEGKTTFCVKKLENTTEFNNYKRSLREYKFKKVVAFSALPLTLVYSAYAYTTYNKNEKLIKEHLQYAKDAKIKYETSLSIVDIEQSKNDYYEEKDVYENYIKNNNRLAKIAAVAIPVGILASATLLYFSSKMKKPAYSEERLLSLNGININYEGSGIYFCQLLITINN